MAAGEIFNRRKRSSSKTKITNIYVIFKSLKEYARYVVIVVKDCRDEALQNDQIRA